MITIVNVLDMSYFSWTRRTLAATTGFAPFAGAEYFASCGQFSPPPGP
jgi:hypothetical protein